MAGSATISWFSVAASSGPSIFTFDTKAQTSTSTHTMTSLPVGCLLVLSICGENDSNNATVGDNQTLTWTKRADAQATNSGDAEIWTAPFAAGGNVTVTGTISAGKQSSVLYVITGQETVFSTTGVTATLQANPSVVVNTTGTNSLIICTTSDFTAQNGALTLRDTATLTLQDFETGAYKGYHYYKQAGASGAYTEGISLPGSQQSGTATIEIRSN